MIHDSDHVDPIGDGTAVPTAVHAYLRGACPVKKLDDGSYYLARYSEVGGVLKSVGDFVGSMRSPGVTVPEEEKMISEIAEPRHGKVRRLLNSAITGHRLDGVEDFARTLANKLLDPLIGRGEVDLLTDFIMPIPASVICDLLRADPQDHGFWQRWADEIAHDSYIRENRNERGVGIEGCFPEASQRFDTMIRTRRNSDDRTDFIARLGQAEVEGELLTDLEMKMVLAFLFAAGSETTRNLLGNLVLKLATEPEFFRRLQVDRSLVEPAIEESLRLNPPLPFLIRHCTGRVQIGESAFDSGDRVVLGVASANRDEDEFAAPDEFRLDRPDSRRHYTFGAGPHVCPGATLARIETRVALNVLLDRVRAVQPAPGWVPTKEPLWWTDGPHDIIVRLVPAGSGV
jgi:cytochrome P450